MELRNTSRLKVRSCPIEDAKEILTDDEIYERISDDKCPSKEAISFPDINYIGVYLDEKIISLAMVYAGIFHFQVLKPYRLKYAREALIRSVDMFRKPLYVEIPSLHKTTINFSKKFGFKEIDMKNNSYLKNGNLYDMHVLVLEN